MTAPFPLRVVRGNGEYDGATFRVFVDDLPDALCADRSTPASARWKQPKNAINEQSAKKHGYWRISMRSS